MAALRAIALLLLAAGAEALKAEETWGWFNSEQKSGFFQKTQPAATETAIRKQAAKAGTKELRAMKVQGGQANTFVEGSRFKTFGQCECLPPSFVYDHMNARCGDGLELAGFDMNKADRCTNFFSRVQFNSCMNTDPGTSSTKQWCYVSKECNDLNGGYGLHFLSKVSVKICKEGVDDFMNQKSATEFHYMGTVSDLDLGTLATLAYPSDGRSWTVAKNAYLSKGKGHDSMRPDRSKKYTVFGRGTPMGPMGIVNGDQVWEIKQSKMLRDQLLVLEMPGKNPSLWHEIQCLQGCGGDTTVPVRAPPNAPQLFSKPWKAAKGAF